MHGLVEHVALALVAQTSAPPGGGLGQLVIPFVMMMAILYFIVIRPQSKERKRQDDMLSSLKRGDEVITSSGILGSVADIEPKFLTLEVARNVKIKVLKSAVLRKYSPQASDDKETEEKKS